MKNTRINWRNARSSLGEILSYPLSPKDGDIVVWASAAGEFSITLDCVNEEGEVIVIPIFHGSSVNGAYSFEGAVAVNFIPRSKTIRLAASVSQYSRDRREYVDPIPKRLVIPSSQDTFEQRLVRQFTDLLDQRTGGGRFRGFNYETYDEYSDTDPAFGRGYTIDELLQEELDRDIAARGNPPTPPADDSVQPSNVSNNDKRKRGKLDVQPATPTPTPASGGDNSELIAAINAALASLGKSTP